MTWGDLEGQVALMLGRWDPPSEALHPLERAQRMDWEQSLVSA